MADPYEDRLLEYIEQNDIPATHLSFEQSCHSVLAAAQAVGTDPENIVKSICLIDRSGHLIVAIVKGEDRVNPERVGKILGIPAPRMANPDEMLVKTGYPRGGTPPFGYDAVFLIDPRVMEREFIYAGGGTDRHLVRIAPDDLKQANGAKIVAVRQSSD